jgi:hypothetical protein
MNAKRGTYGGLASVRVSGRCTAWSTGARNGEGYFRPGARPEGILNAAGHHSADGGVEVRREGASGAACAAEDRAD